MDKKSLLILGSTGSIGTQTLDIVRSNPDKFEVLGLTANSSVTELSEQIREFSPKWAVIADADKYSQLKDASSGTKTELFSGADAIEELVSRPEVDIVVNSLVGFSGFIPTCKALEAGKKVALANKESLVVGGELLKEYTQNGIRNLIPVDSEHSAILQCLAGEEQNEIEKLTITASGGPFRDWPSERMKDITISDALNHPNWSMGSKITIDSATMMNKGLEIIEAYWLFNLPLEKIEPLVHPQSIIHSMVTFADGSVKAQLGHPDMKVPILYALTYPNRIYLDTPRLDLAELGQLTFEPVDFQRFPCLQLAMNAIGEGGYFPAVLNASNEVAVQRFLNGEIPYIGIPRIVESCMNEISNSSELSLDSIIETDRMAREKAATITF